MKKIIFTILLSFITIGASAQFEAGTKYIGSSLTGLDFSYGSKQKLNLGVQANAGLFVADAVLLRASVAYQHTQLTDDISAGLGARYYILQNGIFLGAGGEFVHVNKNLNDLVIPVELGYAFYLNSSVTLEPSVFYKMSINDFANGSRIGFNFGLGIYL